MCIYRASAVSHIKRNDVEISNVHIIILFFTSLSIAKNTTLKDTTSFIVNDTHVSPMVRGPYILRAWGIAEAIEVICESARLALT